MSAIIKSKDTTNLFRITCFRLRFTRSASVFQDFVRKYRSVLIPGVQNSGDTILQQFANAMAAADILSSELFHTGGMSWKRQRQSRQKSPQSCAKPPIDPRHIDGQTLKFQSGFN